MPEMNPPKIVDKEATYVEEAVLDDKKEPVLKDGKPVTRRIKTEPKWFVNLSEFRFPHGTRQGVVFESGTPIKIMEDAWIKGQAPIIAEVPDPFGELPESPVVVASPLTNSDTGQPATGTGVGPVKK